MADSTGPQDSGQRVRTLYERFNARDLEALEQIFTADVDYDWSRTIGPDQVRLQGWSHVRDFLREAWEHWEEIQFTPEETVANGDWLVVFVHVRLRGRGGIEVEARGPHVLRWRSGRVAGYALYQDREDALAAIGL